FRLVCLSAQTDTVQFSQVKAFPRARGETVGRPRRYLTKRCSEPAPVPMPRFRVVNSSRSAELPILAVGAILTEGSSCCCALLPTGRWRWRRCRLALNSEKPLKKVARGSGSSGGGSTGHLSICSPAHSSLRICFRFDIRRCVRRRHLRSGSLRRVGIFFVVASEIASLVIISH